jgi:hypothetical protein
MLMQESRSSEVVSVDPVEICNRRIGAQESRLAGFNPNWLFALMHSCKPEDKGTSIE